MYPECLSFAPTAEEGGALELALGVQNSPNLRTLCDLDSVLGACGLDRREGLPWEASPMAPPSPPRPHCTQIQALC